MPYAEWLAIDLNVDTQEDIWVDRLKGVEAVVNCAGILQSSIRQTVAAVHTSGPAALFDACLRAGVSRVIQISALGIEADTEYARSKAAADAHLASLDIDWVIVQPSLVFAPGAYGGTALFRAMAAVPFVVTVPGDGEQQFQPVAMSDLTGAVIDLLAPTTPARRTVIVAGPEYVPLRRVLVDLRQWLGFKPAAVLPIPMWLVRPVLLFTDLAGWLGGRGSLRSTALAQIAYGSTGPLDAYRSAFGREPLSFDAALARHPSQVQDKWHARLYFLRPVLRVTMALFWIMTGVLSLMDSAWRTPGGQMLAAAVPPDLMPAARWGGAALDICLGLLLFIRWRVPWVCAAMLAVTAGYLGVLSVIAPALWLDPLGPLIKTLPIALALLVIAAIEPDR
jgi:uncharacterized protein YbjT (DUF2867 family)